MFTLKREVPKGVGAQVGNLLRQVMMNSTQSWKLIAFSISDRMNLLNSSDDIVEEMTMVASRLSSLEFDLDDRANGVYVASYTFTREFRSDDICNDMIKVNKTDKLIVSSISDAPKKIELMFYKSSGARTPAQNREVLEAKMFAVSSLYILGTVHAPVKDFRYNIEEGINSETLAISFDCTGDPKLYMQSSIETVVTCMRGLWDAMAKS